MSSRSLRNAAASVFAVVLTCSAFTMGCASQPRAAVSLSMARAATSPADASVYIDEEYIGPLEFVAAHGVRLPEGEHRITIQRAGYFPWDQILISDRKPIHLLVNLLKIPD